MFGVPPNTAIGKYTWLMSKGWGTGAGGGRGRAHPFEIKPPPPPPPPPRCLERVRWEREVQLMHPFETTGGGGACLERVWLSSLLYHPFVYFYIFIYLFLFCLFIYFEFNYLLVDLFIHS